MKKLSKIYDWLKEIDKKHPPFDASTWTPPSFRRKLVDIDGCEYRNFRWSHQTKTWWYEIKCGPNERWSGPYHGRLIGDFSTMKDISALST